MKTTNEPACCLDRDEGRKKEESGRKRKEEKERRKMKEKESRGKWKKD